MAFWCGNVLMSLKFNQSIFTISLMETRTKILITSEKVEFFVGTQIEEEKPKYTYTYSHTTLCQCAVATVCACCCVRTLTYCLTSVYLFFSTLCVLLPVIDVVLLLLFNNNNSSSNKKNTQKYKMNKNNSRTVRCQPSPRLFYVFLFDTHTRTHAH